jgi:tetratricopeptide (TPR) repeat protein
VLATVCVALFSSSPEVLEAKRLYEEGNAFYRTADYDKALEAYSKAYALSAAPELLFNIAQAYQLKGPSGCEAAGRFYRRYLAQVPNAENRELVQQRLAKLGPCADERPIETPLEPAPEPVKTLDAVAAPVPAPEPSVRSTMWRGWGPLGVALAGVAAAGVGLGVYLWTSRDLDVSAAQGCHPHCSATASSLEQRADISYVFVGLGAAVLIAGVLWGIVTAQ